MPGESQAGLALDGLEHFMKKARLRLEIEEEQKLRLFRCCARLQLSGDSSESETKADFLLLGLLLVSGRGAV